MPRKKGFKHSEETKAKMRAKRLAYLADHPEAVENLRRFNLGKPLSEEHKKKITQSLTGKTLTEEHRKNVSKGLMGHPGYWKGKEHTQEYKDMMSAALMGHETSPETREKIAAPQRGREFTEEHRAKLKVARMKRKLPKGDTKPEIAVRAVLDDMGIVYERPGVLPGINSQFDFYIPSWKVIIQVDGCYYHACPRCFPLVSGEEKMSREERVLRDRIEEVELARLYPEIFLHRVWEHDVVDVRGES